MGFDENGVLVYKVPVDAEAPVEAPVEDLLFDPLLGDD